MKLVIAVVKYAGLLLLLALLPWTITQIYYASSIYSFEKIRPAAAAIVFGAGLNSRSTPSLILAERVQIAAKLYQQKKVRSILLSGDGLSEFHNEPAAMRKLALKLGVPAEDLILDYAGNDTYNTCSNAKDIFEINEAILVTQPYHLPRALFICNNVGVNSIGIDAALHKKNKMRQLYRDIREIPATFAAWIEVFSRI